MKSRCHNKNRKCYKYYGGRGIRVCEDWQIYDNFIRDMLPTYKEGLTLDRIDNDGDYCKENCRWVTMKEQMSNTRINIIYKGETATDASIRLGGLPSLVSSRLRNGWSYDSAFNTPNLKKINERNIRRARMFSLQ
jgi:hypothetical protein